MTRFCKLTEQSPGIYGLPGYSAIYNENSEVDITIQVGQDLEENPIYQISKRRLGLMTESQRREIGYATWLGDENPPPDYEAYNIGASVQVLNANGVLTTYPDRTLKTAEEIAPQLARLANNIDVAAEACRQAYITTGYGQAMSYQEKAAEATDCLANYSTQNPPPADKYPLLESEVGITGATVIAVATAVNVKRLQWKQLEKVINTLRMNGKKQVLEAPDLLTGRAVAPSITWPFPEA